jgi:HEPN domain-containing protein
MEEIDAQLERRSIPVLIRAFHAHSEYCKRTKIQEFLISPLTDYPQSSDPSLSKLISDWYSTRWGAKANVDWSSGSILMLLRGEVFVSKVPLVVGSVSTSVLATIADMTNDFALSLSEEELDYVKATYQEGASHFEDIERMISKVGLRSAANPETDMRLLLINALDDARKAVLCLQYLADTNGSRFHSQQLAEKSLKAFLTQRAQRYGRHNLTKIHGQCVGEDRTFDIISDAVRELSAIDMTIRYSEPKSSVRTAYCNFWSSLRVASFSARKIVDC